MMVTFDPRDKIPRTIFTKSSRFLILVANTSTLVLGFKNMSVQVTTLYYGYDCRHLEV